MKTKKNYLLFLFLLCTQIILAQNLTVKSFKIAEDDITASSNPRNDANGDPCALIKVHIPDELVKVEGAYVEPITTVGIEKRIYVPTSNGTGASSLILYTAHYQPLKVVYSDYISKTLNARCTYVLNIAETPSSRNDIGSQYFVLSMTPTDAVVNIDGTPTPHDADGTMQMLLAYGNHTYTVSAPGYESKHGTFVIGRERLNMSVSLTSVKSMLKVTCATPDCGIYVNDKLVGTDKWEGTLVAGTYNVEARKEKYHNSSQIVTLLQKDNKNIELKPLVAMTGQINVSYKPTNADVFIDGTKVGTSPDIFRDIMVGNHSLEISKSGYESDRMNVTVKENAVSDVVGNLKSVKLTPTSTLTHTHSSSSASSSSNVMPITVNGVTFNMIKVDSGTFTMGRETYEQEIGAYDDEKPAHSVTLSEYFIGQTEVTQALWTAVMGSNPSNYKGDNKPVEQVSWDDCQEFISRLNDLTGKTFALPTEAQWEYAARGGKSSQNNKYSGSNNINNVSWCEYNSNNMLHDVATKNPNELGIYDMSGNVWEWCSDLYGNYSSKNQTNPIGATSGSCRVRRGGSWDYITSGSIVTYRLGVRADYRNKNLGLRLELDE